jgi:hypothetical protein
MPPTTEQKRAFHGATIELIQAISREVYRPTYFIQLMASEGAYAAACQVVSSSNLPDGFQRLLQENRPELTIEYLVTRPEWAELFEPEILEAARHRLAMFQRE